MAIGGGYDDDSCLLANFAIGNLDWVLLMGFMLLKFE